MTKKQRKTSVASLEKTMTNKQRILITVKTYPTLSKKYGETVCTAGVREDGTWVRMYPVPFRRLNEKEQYKKYDWVECQLVRSTKDSRPETYHPVDQTELQPVDHINTDNHWRERRRILLKNAKVFTSLDEVIAKAKANEISLAVFKPSKIVDFICKAEEDPHWDPTKVQKMRDRTKQYELFDDHKWRETFDLIPKLPYSFSYKFEDENGKLSKLRVFDWEIGQLYWNCLKSTNKNEAEALAKVKQKYFDTFSKTDLHFFLGTTQQFHSVAPNPWIIIGVLPIPHECQPELF